MYPSEGCHALLGPDSGRRMAKQTVQDLRVHIRLLMWFSPCGASIRTLGSPCAFGLRRWTLSHLSPPMVLQSRPLRTSCASVWRVATRCERSSSTTRLSRVPRGGESTSSACRLSVDMPKAPIGSQLGSKNVFDTVSFARRRLCETLCRCIPSARLPGATGTRPALKFLSLPTYASVHIISSLASRVSL